MKRVEDYVRSIPDFPEPGIIFRDVTTILQDGEGLHLAIDKLIEMVDGIDFDVVVGPESEKALSPSAKKASCPARPSVQNTT